MKKTAMMMFACSLFAVACLPEPEEGSKTVATPAADGGADTVPAPVTCPSGQVNEGGKCRPLGMCEPEGSLGTVCQAAGPCENFALCVADSHDCPATTYKTTGTVCQKDNKDGTCNGTDAECHVTVAPPVLGKCEGKAKGTLCNAVNPNNPCDIAEFCDGNSKDCPADAFSPVDTVCTTTSGAGKCDASHTCVVPTPAPAPISCPNGTVKDPSDGLCKTPGDVVCFAGAAQSEFDASHLARIKTCAGWPKSGPSTTLTVTASSEFFKDGGKVVSKQYDCTVVCYDEQQIPVPPQKSGYQWAGDHRISLTYKDGCLDLPGHDGKDQVPGTTWTGVCGPRTNPLKP